MLIVSVTLLFSTVWTLMLIADNSSWTFSCRPKCIINLAAPHKHDKTLEYPFWYALSYTLMSLYAKVVENTFRCYHARIQIRNYFSQWAFRFEIIFPNGHQNMLRPLCLSTSTNQQTLLRQMSFSMPFHFHFFSLCLSPHLCADL